MNLIGDPWIPVIGRACQRMPPVGLRELFEKAGDLGDLALPPLERVAVTRLLLCIAQKALDGPKDYDDWKACRDKIAPAALAYLEKWKPRFELYGPEPFLQVPELEDKRNAGVDDRLGFGSSAGNTPLFDHGAMYGERMRIPAWVAPHLLTCQCFALGGLIRGPKWAGQETAYAAESAPCAEQSMLLVLLRGPSVLDSILLNMVTRSDLQGIAWGRPVWEQYPPGPEGDGAEALAASYLGRLVPLARAIKLYQDEPVMSYAGGIQYPKLPEGREPMAAVVVRDSDGEQVYRYVKADPARHPWRELGAVLALSSGAGSGGALCLAKLRRSQQADMDVWVGGLLCDKSKLLDVAEWSFHLPGGILGATSLAEYENGVKMADSARGRLRYAINIYGDAMKLESKSGLIQRAESHYWTQLEGRSPELANLASSGAVLAPWTKTVWATAHGAYAVACPHTTPREIQAFAIGKRALCAPVRTEEARQGKGAKTKKTRAKKGGGKEQ